MSPTKRPSAVTGLQKAVATTPAPRPSETSSAVEPVSLPPRPEKPVRFTLDLDQIHHQFLKTFAAQTGPGAGGAQVLRALLDELEANPNLANRVRTRIWEAKR